MKKHLSALLAVAAIYAPLSAHASDGTINFSGALAATTCTVTSGGATPLGVSLPTLATTAPNPTAGDTSFSLTVTGCTGPTSATTYFEAGPTINLASGRLFNTAAGGPANIELELLNDTGSTINLAGNSGSQGVLAATVSSGSAVANFIVRYYHTDLSAVAAGAVTSAVTYSMIYN